MHKTCRILGINTSFSSLDKKSFVQDSIRSTRSFLDYDLIFIDTSYLLSTYEEDYTMIHYNGELLFPKDKSSLILDDFERIEEQINQRYQNYKDYITIKSEES